jgi:hypothetical protein
MSYNPNIPQSTDDPKQSQGQLLSNFSQLNSQWLVNHIPLTSGGNNGLHKMVQFAAALSVDPTVTGNQSAVYPKLSGSNVELFFRNAGFINQLTGLPVVTTTPGATGSAIRTPWGITINYGILTNPSTTINFQLTYSSPPSVFLTLKSITVPTPRIVPATVSVSTGSFVYQINNDCYFFAFGLSS